MASLATHSVAALAVCTAVALPRLDGKRRAAGRRVAVLAVLSMIGAALPDCDAVGYLLHTRYDAVFGHRGLTHSLAFAALFALVAALTVPRAHGPAAASWSRARVALALFLAAASHGVIDALSAEGLGVAFLWPFTRRRWFLPWRPLAADRASLVDPDVRWWRSQLVSASELRWIWLPAAALVLVAWCVAAWVERRRSRRPRAAAATGRSYDPR